MRKQCIRFEISFFFIVNLSSNSNICKKKKDMFYNMLSKVGKKGKPKMENLKG